MNEKVYEARGIKMHYWTGGKKDGKVILWLHGGGVGAMVYRKHLEMLGAKFKVMAPDLPGFGKSDLPDEVWGLGDYAEFLEGFLKSLRINRVVVVGHSLGGGVAVNLAVRSRLVARLVLGDAVGIPPKLSEWELAVWGLKKTGRQLRVRKNKMFVWLIIKSFLGNMVKLNRRLPQLREMVEKCVYEDYTRVIREVKVPTLILWGSKDELFPIEYAMRFNKLIKGSKLVVFDGDHDQVMFEVERCGGLIEEWVG